MKSDLPPIKRPHLALRNGQDKPNTWTTYKGVVYEINRSRPWREGKHNEHWAGHDLATEIVDAPYTDQTFAKFKQVGRLGGISR